MDKYRHKNLNTVYVLTQRSQIIHLLDFKNSQFLSQRILAQHELPSQFTSIQTEIGSIYLIGGT
jgi:hypothetical protein